MREVKLILKIYMEEVFKMLAAQRAEMNSFRNQRTIQQFSRKMVLKKDGAVRIVF